MYQLAPAPTMISPSMATKLFGTVEAGAPSLLALKGMGDSIGYQVVNQELTTFGSDYLYNFYYLETQTEQGDPRNYCVATTNVNPYLMIELDDHPGEPYAIFKPEDVSFNGDVIWTLHWHNNDIECNLLMDQSYADYPDAITSKLSSVVRPNSGYFSIQRTGTDSGQTTLPRLVWTKYIEDAYIPYGQGIMQYPWDTLDWKMQHQAAISAWNASHSWDEYVPMEPVYHGVTGAKYAYYTYVDPVDPLKYGFLNGPAMTFYPAGDGMGKMKPFYGYFFYPLLYLDSAGTGVLHKLNKDEEMPTFLSASYRADYSGIGAYTTYLDDEILSGPSTKKYGTPIWKLDFPDCPFEVDEDRNYFCAFVSDGAILTVNISNTNQAWQAYCNRPTVKNNVIMWSEPKSNAGDGTPGKDVQVEDFLSVGLERTKDYQGHSNWFRFTSCVFKSPSTGAIYKTDGIPHRGNGATANEWVPDPVTPYKGGRVIMTWYRNSVFPITQYYLTDIDSFRTQPVLDGADMHFGIFQVLETRVNPNSN